MLSVVKILNRKQHWYERGHAVRDCESEGGSVRAAT